jgi:hypothetical protein
MSGTKSRLFHAIVVVGCALTQVSGCGDAADEEDAGHSHEDAGAQHEAGAGHDGQRDADAGMSDAGWPPTK